MIYQLSYRSRATYPRGHLTDLDIMRRAIAVNSERGLTGFLGRHHQIFIQILEGDKADVQEVMAQIERDPRHFELEILSQGFVKQRDFADWSMGYADLSELRELEKTATGAKLALVTAAQQTDAQVQSARFKSGLHHG